MDRQKLIDEIRGLQKTKSKFSLEDIETEIRKRKGSPYNKIADYDETDSQFNTTENVTKKFKMIAITKEYNHFIFSGSIPFLRIVFVNSGLPIFTLSAE